MDNSVEQKLNNKISQLEKELRELKDMFTKHTHNGRNSKHVDGELKSTEGSFHDLGHGLIASITQRPSATVDTTAISAGIDKQRPSNGIGTGKNTEFYIRNSGAGSPSSIFASGNPSYGNFSGSARVNGSSITDSSFGWETDELVNNYVVISDSSGNTVAARKVVSNSTDTINLDSSTGLSGNYSYSVVKGVLLGTAPFPFRRAYVENGEFGGIRFGIGATGGGDNSLLYTDGNNLKFRRPNGSSVTIA